MVKTKYMILDFGGVIAGPSTGHWDMTPKFLELIDITRLDIEKMKDVRKKYSYILSEHVVTLEEEYDMFTRFYDNILRECGYPNYTKDMADAIAYNRTYEFDKYRLYEGVKEELLELKTKQILLLLTDNRPCVIPYKKRYGNYDLFDKIYISSIYGVENKDKVFFDYPIRDFHIKSGEAIFIDDNEKLLDIAKDKGLDVRLMDRENKVIGSKYKLIKSLNCL